MTISPFKNLNHFKVTIKFLEDKMKDLIKRNSEEESSESESSSDLAEQNKQREDNLEKNKQNEKTESESESSSDLAEQKKMIKKIIENQKVKEALEQAKAQQNKEREDNLEKNKQNEKMEVFEFLLREDELKIMLKFCSDNKIEISAKRILSQNLPIEEKIAEILHKGPGASHSNSSNNHRQP